MYFNQFHTETEEDHKPRLKERLVDACKIVLIITIAICLVLVFVAFANRHHNSNHTSNTSNGISGISGGINRNNNKNNNNNNRQNGFVLLNEDENENEDTHFEVVNFNLFSHFDLLSPEFTARISAGEFLEILQSMEIKDLSSLMLADSLKSAVSNTGQDILKRTQKLIGNLSFTIIDMNKDKSIEKNEWSMFVKEAFPKDYQQYNNLFMEMNKGKPVTEFEYLSFLSSTKFAAVQPPITPKSTTNAAIKKIILMNTLDYQQTTLTIFEIFSIKNTNVVTRIEAKEILIKLGSTQQTAASTVDQFFEYAENNQFLTKKNQITLTQFQRLAMSVQKSLETQYLKQQNQQKEEQDSNQNISMSFFMDEQSIPPNDSIVGMFSLKMKSILSALLNKEVKSMNQPEQSEISNVLNKSIDYSFNILDTNHDSTITAEEFGIIAKFLFQNEYDFEIIQQWFKSITQDKETVSKKDFRMVLMEKVHNAFFISNNGQEAKKNYSLKFAFSKNLQETFHDFLLACSQRVQLTDDFIFEILDSESKLSLSPVRLREDLMQFSEKVSQNKVNQMIKKSFQNIKKNGAIDGNNVSKEEWMEYLVSEKEKQITESGQSQVSEEVFENYDSTPAQTLLFFFGL